jgi:hypothetical protein
MLHFVVLSQLQPYAVVVVSHQSDLKFAPSPSQIALGTNAAQNSESVGKLITGGPEGGPEDPEGGPVSIVYLDAESSELSLKNDRRPAQSFLNEATAMESFCVSVKEEMPAALAASSHAVTTSHTPNSAAY